MSSGYPEPSSCVKKDEQDEAKRHSINSSSTLQRIWLSKSQSPFRRFSMANSTQDMHTKTSITIIIRHCHEVRISSKPGSDVRHQVHVSIDLSLAVHAMRTPTKSSSTGGENYSHPPELALCSKYKSNNLLVGSPALR